MRKHPDRLVFIDETSVKTNLTRQYGRSLCGKRLEMDAPFGAWGTQTFIAGLKHDNLIAPWVIKGAMDGEAFEAYVRNVLAPELQPGTVVICDNLATHYNQAAAATLREVGCWFLYLPPYSPDLNPIEMAFSKLKAHLRRIGARTFDQMFDALTEICKHRWLSGFKLLPDFPFVGWRDLLYIKAFDDHKIDVRDRHAQGFGGLIFGAVVTGLCRL